MRKLIFIIALGVFSVNFAKAQDVIDSVSATYEYANIDQEALNSLPPQMLAMQQKSITLSIVKNPVSGISKIVVMAGFTEGSNNIFYKEFAYGTDGDFSDGTSYHTSGNTISIETNALEGVPKYFISVFAIMENSDRSPAMKYVLEQ